MVLGGSGTGVGRELACGVEMATPRAQLFRHVPRRPPGGVSSPLGDQVEDRGSGQFPAREGEDPTRSLRSAGLAPALQSAQ